MDSPQGRTIILTGASRGMSILADKLLNVLSDMQI